MQRIGLDWKALNWIRKDWIGKDWIGNNWIGLGLLGGSKMSEFSPRGEGDRLFKKMSELSELSKIFGFFFLMPPLM